MHQGGEVMTWLTFGIALICTPGIIVLFIIYRDYLNWINREKGGAYLITIIDKNLRRMKVSPWQLKELLDRGEVLKYREKSGWFGGWSLPLGR